MERAGVLFLPVPSFHVDSPHKGRIILDIFITTSTAVWCITRNLVFLAMRASFHQGEKHRVICFAPNGLRLDCVGQTGSLYSPPCKNPHPRLHTIHGSHGLGLRFSTAKCFSLPQNGFWCADLRIRCSKYHTRILRKTQQLRIFHDFMLTARETQRLHRLPQLHRGQAHRQMRVGK